MEEEASYSTLGVREETTLTLDTPQLPSPSPVTDGPPTRSLGTEHIEDRLLDPAHFQYDIV